jgi:hypothetical protein
MKPFIYATLLAIIISISSINNYAGNPVKMDSTEYKECLEIVGITIGENNEAINGVHVKLYKENDELEWTEITNVSYHDHNFSFRLNANENYTIEVSKPGFISRSVGISTMLPNTVSLNPIYRYEFEVELFKEKKGVDDYYNMDFPVALISYDKKNDVFNNNAYTKHIKTKIKEALEQAQAITDDTRKK